MFKIGQKVVCIDDEWTPDYSDGSTPNLPKLNNVYTVRGVVTWTFFEGKAKAIYLEEIINPVMNWMDEGVAECPFWIKRFAPVIQKETDISALQALLNPANHKPNLTDNFDRKKEKV